MRPPLTVRARMRGLCSAAVEHMRPTWFTAVMGTGIVAVAVTLAPIKLAPLRGLGIALWVGAVALFAVLLVIWVAHGLRYPSQMRACLSDPAFAQLWGAPPIACFTIALGFLVIGPPLVGTAHSLALAQILWLAGVVGAIFAALIVPYLMFTQHKISTEMTIGTWLLPVVAPLLASVPGAMLAPHWPAAWRASMLAASYALWGMGTLLSAIVVILLYSRLTYHKVPAGAQVTTLWIVLGPLGASIAGLSALGTAATALLPAVGPALNVMALIYGLPVWGFAMYWLALSILVTARAWRVHLPFTLGWWALIFPVGVLTTGTYALSGRTHAPLFTGAGVALLLLLAVLWVLVASHTARQCFWAAKEALQLTRQPPAIAPSSTLARPPTRAQGNPPSARQVRRRPSMPGDVPRQPTRRDVPPRGA
jgi:C4-dicarboxylate transporter/malic acid transport protein